MKVLMNKKDWRDFPDCPKIFPDNLLSEEMAYTNHGQSLEKLDSRGGLHPCEIVWNCNKIGAKEYTGSESLNATSIAVRRIKAYILNNNKQP